MSSPATASGETPSGRFQTGSSAKASMAPSESTSETLLCASTATTFAIPLLISISAVATPSSPSPATVCTGLCAAPSWSGTYSSKMLVPSRRSSEQQTNESISLRGSRPASSYARWAASNISSLYDRPEMIGANPACPTPMTATRSTGAILPRQTRGAMAA